MIEHSTSCKLPGRIDQLCGSRAWRRLLPLALFAVLTMGCATGVLKVNNSEEILKNEEFEQAIQVEAMPLEESGEYVKLPGPAPVKPASASAEKGKTAASNAPPKTPSKTPSVAAKQAPARNSDKPLVGRKASKPVKEEPSQPAAPAKRQPEIEDSEGFDGRRPISDPYRVGERVTLEVSYFGVVAGDLSLDVRPFVQVNGRKSYSFGGRALSSSTFSMFYSVDDRFETFVDYETMVPYSYALNVKESKQIRETRTVFDWKENKAIYWDKKIGSNKKVEEKKEEWEIAAYAQNVFTAVYYLRTFQLKPGKKIAFNLAHENENLVVTADVLKRERITTPAGAFNTVVIKPKIELNGVFKPVGDIFIWMTDDDRKFPVRIESKIKIGKVVGAVKSIEPGQ